MNTFSIALTILTLALLAGFIFKVRQWVQAIRLDLNRIEDRLNQLHHQTNDSISRATQQIVNTTCISSLGFQFPVFLSGWSIDSFLAQFLIQHIMEHRPKRIVELGSGSSTIIIARSLQLLGENDTHHIAVDHEAKYLSLTSEIAKLNGVTEGIEFMHCPLVQYESLDKLWYGGLTEKLDDHKIDLLIIDGPPGALQSMSRYPALPLLLPYMSECCTVVLDDAVRDEEQKIAQRWVHENPEFNLTLSLDGHGLAILTRKGR